MAERAPGRCAALLALLLTLASTLEAQGPTPVNRALATRQDLEAALSQGRSGSGPKLSERERQALQTRLEQGDFLEGDRLVLRVTGEKALSDTFTVRAGQSLELPEMAPLSLHGVLRSELEEKVRGHVAQYIRTPTVSAEALLRIGILGAVARPGYYNVRADQPLGDLPTVASGLAADADLGKARLLRDGAEFWPKDDVRRAMASGRSVDMLGLRGGDELMIGRRGGGFGATLAIVTGVLTLATTIVLLSRN
jgi:polysaccharide biosynthesis/export protein